MTQKKSHWAAASHEGSRAFAAAVIFNFVLSVAGHARGDATACIASHAAGQREVNAGRLILASELFVSCASSEECPNAIRAECVERYRDVEKSTPTVIFSVVDEHGKDLTDVQVYSTDQLLAQSLNGRSVTVDPGKHVFRFILPGGEAISEDVLIREGEKNRIVSARVREHGQARTESPPEGRLSAQRQDTPASSAASPNSLPAGFWVVAGISGTALASFGVFALLGHSQQSDLDNCSPNCAVIRHDDFDAMRRNYLIADVSLGVAAASAGIAAWFFFSSSDSTSPVDEHSTVGSSTRVSVVPLLSAPGFSLQVNTTAF